MAALTGVAVLPMTLGVQSGRFGRLKTGTDGRPVFLTGARFYLWVANPLFSGFASIGRKPL